MHTPGQRDIAEALAAQDRPTVRPQQPALLVGPIYDGRRITDADVEWEWYLRDATERDYE